MKQGATSTEDETIPHSVARSNLASVSGADEVFVQYIIPMYHDR